MADATVTLKLDTSQFEKELAEIARRLNEQADKIRPSAKRFESSFTEPSPVAPVALLAVAAVATQSQRRISRRSLLGLWSRGE